MGLCIDSKVQEQINLAYGGEGGRGGGGEGGRWVLTSIGIQPFFSAIVINLSSLREKKKT